MKFRWILLSSVVALALLIINQWHEWPHSRLFAQLIKSSSSGEAEWNEPVDLLTGSNILMGSLEFEVDELVRDGFVFWGLSISNKTVPYFSQNEENICKNFLMLSAPQGTVFFRKMPDLFLREYSIRIEVNSQCEIVGAAGSKLKPAHP